MSDVADRLAFFDREDGLFVIPLEAISASGVQADLGAWLVSRRRLDEAAVQFIDQVLKLYWETAAALHRSAPTYWPPPRAQHLAIVDRPDWVRPFFQVFHKNSWLLYRSDVDPKHSSIEFAVFLLLFSERLGLVRQILPALAANLSYFVCLDPERRADFASGARSQIRPDAVIWHALADALDELAEQHHVELNPPALALPHAQFDPVSGLLLDSVARQRLDQLHDDARRGAVAAIDRHVAAHACIASAGVRQLGEWLAAVGPRVLVCGADLSILWDPDRPGELAGLDRAIPEISASALHSVTADLEIIDARTSAFLDDLVDADALSTPAGYLTATGLCHIHPDRRLLAYVIGGGDHDYRLRQAAPPYERLMLAARAAHEWGHLAAQSGWVGVPTESEREAGRLFEGMADLLDASLKAAPGPWQQAILAHNAPIAARDGSLGRGLVRAIRSRLEDYSANLVARRFLAADEMQTYVRNNVACRIDEYRREEAYQEILRYAYELQYLSLAGIRQPSEWLSACTWFERRFVEPGLIKPAAWTELIELMGALCALIRVDESRFRSLDPGRDGATAQAD